jgi:hypothetical protein
MAVSMRCCHERREDEVSTNQAPWALIDREDLAPICPHCEQALEVVYRRGTGFPLGQGRTLVYFCPHCHKTLGFAQGRVF